MADINIYGTLVSKTGDSKLVYASQVYDESQGKFQDEINEEGGGGGGAENAVLYIAQTLTTAQKTQARTNIGAGTYSKPSSGIPKTDFASAVQTSLGKADSAEQQSNKTSDISSNKTSTSKYPTTKGVVDYVDTELGDVEDVLDAILGADTLHEQKKMDVVSASGTTLSAAVNTYYNFASDVNTLAVTLPSVTDSTHINNIVFMLTTGSTPAVTFAAPTGINVIAQDGFSIEASTTYEINAIFNGTAWVVAAMKLSTTPINS